MDKEGPVIVMTTLFLILIAGIMILGVIKHASTPIAYNQQAKLETQGTERLIDEN